MIVWLLSKGYSGKSHLSRFQVLHQVLFVGLVGGVVRNKGLVHGVVCGLVSQLDWGTGARPGPGGHAGGGRE